jgi:uncharacterized protein (TIGR00255 family)
MGKAGGKVASMTGFARAEGGDDLYAWAWEIKSVNGRGLDLRWRLPPGLDALEPRLRPLLAKACTRGSLQINLQMSVKSGGEALSLNKPLVDRILALQRELSKDPAAANLAPLSFDGLFALRGVLESERGEDAEEKEKRNKALEKDFRIALEALTAARAREGEALFKLLEKQIGAIGKLVAKARRGAEAQPKALAKRLEEQLAELLAEDRQVSEERLAQEVALLALKADVREELDRLEAHVAEALALLYGGGAMGRRLDFLCQEFNREANTLCSKATGIALTRMGLELKALVEQMREQVQNLE